LLYCLRSKIHERVPDAPSLLRAESLLLRLEWAEPDEAEERAGGVAELLAMVAQLPHPRRERQDVLRHASRRREAEAAVATQLEWRHVELHSADRYGGMGRKELGFHDCAHLFGVLMLVISSG
jgi:hypothetical protein